jgi:hypothetical protein
MFASKWSLYLALTNVGFLNKCHDKFHQIKFLLQNYHHCLAMVLCLSQLTILCPNLTPQQLHVYESL